MNKKEIKLFSTLRKKVADCLKRRLDAGEAPKHYEGTWEVQMSYPNYFEDMDASAPPDFCCISLRCYLIGPGRGYKWEGKSFMEALKKCKKDINKWTKD